jgi:hypothetical protein
MRIPCRPSDLVSDLIADARRLRNLHWLLARLDESTSFDTEWIEGLFAHEMISEIGLMRRSVSGGRFRATESYNASESSYAPNAPTSMDIVHHCDRSPPRGPPPSSKGQ